jgi:hypothetical protein
MGGENPPMGFFAKHADGSAGVSGQGMSGDQLIAPWAVKTIVGDAFWPSGRMLAREFSIPRAALRGCGSRIRTVGAGLAYTR